MGGNKSGIVITKENLTKTQMHWQACFDGEVCWLWKASKVGLTAVGETANQLLANQCRTAGQSGWNTALQTIWCSWRHWRWLWCCIWLRTYCTSTFVPFVKALLAVQQHHFIGRPFKIGKDDVLWCHAMDHGPPCGQGCCGWILARWWHCSLQTPTS